MAEDTRLADFTRAQKQAEANNTVRIRLEEKLEAATKRLRELVGEIKALGYDPKTFEQDVAALDEQATSQLRDYQAAVQAQTVALQAIEAQL